MGICTLILVGITSLADRNQDAVEAAKAGIQFLPKEHLAYTNLCRAYNDIGQYQLAINACNAALRITPDDGETYFYLGRAYDLTNKPNEATKAYDKPSKVSKNIPARIWIILTVFTCWEMLILPMDSRRKRSPPI